MWRTMLVPSALMTLVLVFSASGSEAATRFFEEKIVENDVKKVQVTPVVECRHRSRYPAHPFLGLGLQVTRRKFDLGRKRLLVHFLLR